MGTNSCAGKESRPQAQPEGGAPVSPSGEEGERDKIEFEEVDDPRLGAMFRIKNKHWISVP